MKKEEITLRVNGDTFQVLVEPWRSLVDVLREDLGLTGTKRSCNRGLCGACTVIMDGRPVNSCLVLAEDAREREITTIEGLTRDGELHELQEAFIKFGAVQCGFCTPGMILSAKALLDQNPRPVESEIRRALQGNLCRCTGYVKIVKAIQNVSTMSEAR